MEFILLGVLWASWICGLVSDINLGEMLSHYCFTCFLYSFLFLVLLVFLWHVCYMICSFSIVLAYSLFWLLFFFFLVSLFSLLFHSASFYWHMLKCRDSFLSHDKPSLLSHQRHSSFLSQIFDLWYFFLIFFLEFPIYSSMLPTYLSKASTC